MGTVRKIGLGMLVLGAVVTLYGALGFFVWMEIWPNNEFEGRLPSLWVMFSGMGAMLTGAAVKGLRMGKRLG